MSRYSEIRNNTDSHYSDLHRSRGVTSIFHFTTPMIPIITAGSRSTIAKKKHIWRPGDRYWKLAERHYGNAEFWWVIARYNFAPTEFHVKAGNLIYIPYPLERAIALVGG